MVLIASELQFDQFKFMVTTSHVFAHVFRLGKETINEMGGSAGFVLQGYGYVAIACLISGPIVAVLEWCLFQFRTSWKSAALLFPIGLLLTGTISAVLIAFATGRDFPDVLVLTQASWQIGLVSVVPYIPIGLIARSTTLVLLKFAWGPKET
jgi:hypothetical protein